MRWANGMSVDEARHAVAEDAAKFLDKLGVTDDRARKALTIHALQTFDTNAKLSGASAGDIVQQQENEEEALLGLAELGGGSIDFTEQILDAYGDEYDHWLNG